MQHPLHQEGNIFFGALGESISQKIHPPKKGFGMQFWKFGALSRMQIGVY
jgi:hypothetical protein